MQMDLELEFLSAIKQLPILNKHNNSEDEFCVDSRLSYEIGEGKTEVRQFGLEKNASNGKKPLRDSMVSKSAKLLVNWLKGKESTAGDCSKGEAELWSSEVEELKKRLKILEEETKTMKETLFASMEERNSLMNEIYRQFQQLHGFLFSANLLIGENSADRNSTVYGPKDVRVGTSLSEILKPQPNPSLVTRDLRANILTVEEAAQELLLLSDR
ncbi:uncharacterized protein LOC107407545 [Ziziphus jujuba]|uniref:Uncharacterized protein LOC107407545 n=1 Tax=Ziziphus jujuba TaxID=326968 RepID=A0A6P3Z5P2_ZIZJJ|nr:uncharacterized protein LOC107407545 [Ziziphus jujuba]XP_024929556.2 uncharacterized protein LOC107407545 [Ziziphus jujuba]